METVILIGIIVLIILCICLLIRRPKENNNSNEDVNKLQNDLKEKETQIAVLQNQINEKENQLSITKNDCLNLQKENNDKTKYIGELEQIKQSSLQKDNTIEELRKENKERSENNSKLQAIVDNQSDYEELRQVNQELQIKLQTTQTQYQAIKEQNQKLQQDFETTKQERDQFEQQSTHFRLELQSSTNSYNTLQEQYLKFQKDFDENQKKFKTEIENITNKILKDSSTDFTKQSIENLKNVLTPFETQMSDFKKKVEDNIKTQTETKSSIEQHIKDMMEGTKRISEQATNLTKALTTNNKVTGNWGENQLKNILLNSGLKEGEDFESQVHYVNNDEDTSRKTDIPDFTINVPADNGGIMKIFVDVKTSLTDYQRYYSAQTDEEKNEALKGHILSIRNHIKELSNKHYETNNNFKGTQVGFVIMFIPIESAYFLALDQDPNIWEEAYKKNIIINTGSTIITSIKLISILWKIENSDKKAQSIITDATNLYNKLVTFLDYFEDLGEKINKVKDQFDKTNKNLVDGNGSLVSKAKSLKEKTLSPKQIPESFL